MTHSEQINELALALSKAQGAMKPAVKDAPNPHFKSKYADLAANVEAAREPLAANGIAVVQEPTAVERGIAVTTMLLHASGQWMRFEPLTVPLAKIDAHGVGSATTYARRYALAAVLGLVAEDDDGNAAVQRASKPAKHDEWFRSLTIAAGAGSDALKKFWKENSVPAQRDYLTQTNNDAWEDLKAHAETIKGAA